MPNFIKIGPPSWKSSGIRSPTRGNNKNVAV